MMPAQYGAGPVERVPDAGSAGSGGRGIKALPDALFPRADACTFRPDRRVCRGLCLYSVDKCTRRRRQTDNSSAASLADHVSPAISSAAARSAS